MVDLRWLLAGVALVALGCGGTSARELPEGAGGMGGVGAAGAGGSGATGGSGGSGGTGGAGGSGGVVSSRCGDGHVDPSEDCDDANTISGDGCSSTCTIEGSCDAPIDWMQVSHDDTLGRVFEGTLRPPAATQEGSCGADGAEVVFRLVAPFDGILSLSHDSGVRSVNYVRTACSDPSTQIDCKPKLVAMKQPVSGGQELFLIFDLPADLEEADFTIIAEVFPYVGEGGFCNVGASAQCAPGLTCNDIAASGRCTRNEPPALTEARGLRFEDDLILLVEGSDPNGNLAFAVSARFFDDAGLPLLAMDRDRDGVADDELLVASFEGSAIRSTAFSYSSRVAGFFAMQPDAVRAEVSVIDTEQVRSAWLPVVIEPQPIVSLGGSCDMRVRADRCVVDATCYPDGGGAPTCQPLSSVRQQRCDAAPLLEFGTIASGAVDRASIDGLGHWDAPVSCIARPGFGAWEQSPEGLARLHLDETAENLVISTDHVGSMDSVLYLLEGCGIDPVPLACNDDITPANPRSELRFDSLPAGDYLIVVDLRSANRVGAVWSLQVDTEP